MGVRGVWGGVGGGVEEDGGGYGVECECGGG